MQKLGPLAGSFKSIRQNAIKQGLTNVLGSTGAVAVIINFNLESYEDDPVAFHNSLFSVFKEPATQIMEKAIVKEVFGQMGEHFESSGAFDFPTHMNFAKQLFRARVVQ